MRRSLLWLFLLLSVSLPAATVRRYEVAIHRSKHAKCDGADLRIDRGGVREVIRSDRFEGAE